MAVRDLGDWSALDLTEDPVPGADVELIDDARKHYKRTSDALQDAVTRLGQLVNGAAEGQRGQWVDGLKDQAGKLVTDLSKAETRYSDVVTAIDAYRKELVTAQDSTKTALDNARTAKDGLADAQAQPVPQPAADGTYTVVDQAALNKRNNDLSSSEGGLTAAKRKLNDAVEQLQTAGKSLGDTANSNHYHDGLQGTEADARLKTLSKVLTWIGLGLAVLAMVFPGVNAFVLAGLAVGVAGLTVDSVLYAHGEGSLADVIVGAVGVGLLGLGTGLGQIAKGLSKTLKGVFTTEVGTAAQNATNIELRNILSGSLRDLHPSRPPSMDITPAPPPAPRPAHVPGGAGQQATSALNQEQNWVNAAAEIGAKAAPDTAAWWNMWAVNKIGSKLFGYVPPSMSWTETNLQAFSNNVFTMFWKNGFSGGLAEFLRTFSGLDVANDVKSAATLTGGSAPAWMYVLGSGLKFSGYLTAIYSVASAQGKIPPVSGPGHPQAQS
jgi:hypothetical protein